MNKIIVIGGGGHAKVLMSIIKKLGTFEILGYTDVLDRGPLLGQSYLGEDTRVAEFCRTEKALRAVFGIGSIHVSEKRKLIYEQLKPFGLHFAPLASPDACVSADAVLGSATVVMGGAIVQAGSKIGEAAILNTHCSVDHDSVIGDFTHIAPGATLCGGVTVGENCLIGAGSVINPGITIASNVLIGSGSVVVSDCKQSGLYLGTPARWVKAI